MGVILDRSSPTWSWTENLESEVVNVQGGKSSSMRLRAETIQGRSTSLSGDDSDSEESELDASEGTGVYRGWDHADGECGASWCKCWRNCSGCCRHWPCCLLRGLLAPADRVGNTSAMNVANASFNYILRNDCICCKDVPESAAADWLLSLAALLAPHSSRKAAATSTHCTLYCVAIWARSISRPDRSHLSWKPVRANSVILSSILHRRTVF